MNTTGYKRCTRCIMDTTDPEIIFDDQGVCNHCRRYDELLPKRVFRGKEAGFKLNKLIEEMKVAGKGKEYDCIIGVSGGVDSTYVAYLIKKLGLRALAVHFDNGWNSELAVSNIEKTLKILDIDLYTYVIDWDTFKNLQIAFLKASTPDGEIPTDHAINALLWSEANKRGIKYIINGMNFATESAAVTSWAYGHSDWKYIRAINRQFGKNKNLCEYPHFTLFDLFYYTVIKGIRTVSILNYIEYNKSDVMNILKEELGWIYYGGKHYESVYTRFYQAYYLPRKFNINKRICHLSDLVHAHQLTRDEALAEFSEKDYSDEMCKQDMDFVLKKFDLSHEEFDAILNLQAKSFRDYPNNHDMVMKIKKWLNQFRKWNLLPR